MPTGHSEVWVVAGGQHDAPARRHLPLRRVGIRVQADHLRAAGDEGVVGRRPCAAHSEHEDAGVAEVRRLLVGVALTALEGQQKALELLEVGVREPVQRARDQEGYTA